jgi:type IV pilus assembly protein PilC
MMKIHPSLRFEAFLVHVSHSWRKSMFSSRIRWKPLAATCRSLGTMLQSGINIQKAFQFAADKTHDATCRRALSGVAQGIARGQDVTSAMREQGDAFPQLMVDMVGVAEQTGALPEILHSLSGHYENNLRLRSNFISAIAFPMFQLVAAILVIAGLILVLGWIADARGGEPIDPLGFGLIGESGAILWLTCTFGTLFGLFIAFKIISRSTSGKRLLDPWLLKVPVLGTCLRSFAIARFSWAYALTQQAGMAILKSIDSSLRATTNGAFIAAAPLVKSMVKAGEPLGDALRETHLFPEEYLHLVEVAETSGTVPEMLDRLSPQFEDQARRSLSGLVTALGWLIWLTVAAFIIFLIFSIVFWYLSLINQFL